MKNLLGYEVNTFDSEYPQETISHLLRKYLQMNLAGYEVNTFDSGYPLLIESEPLP